MLFIGWHPVLSLLSSAVTNGILLGSLSPLLPAVPGSVATIRWNNRGLPVSGDIQVFKNLPSLRKKPLETNPTLYAN